MVPVFGFYKVSGYKSNADTYIENRISELDGFNGKKINFLGDSITYGNDGSGQSSRVEKPYPAIVAEKTKSTCNNYGYPGSTVGGDGSTKSSLGNVLGYMPMNSRITGIDTDADYNIVFGGTNDSKGDRIVPVGSIDDTSVLTFYGALKSIAEYLLTNFPQKKNAFITPLHRLSDEANGYGDNLKSYVDAVKNIGELYGIPVLDLYSNGGGTPKNTAWKNANMTDGLHPTQEYYYKIADKIIAFLKTL